MGREAVGPLASFSEYADYAIRTRDSFRNFFVDEIAYSPLLDLSEYAEYALRSRIVRYGPEGQDAYSLLLDLSEYAEYAMRSRMPSKGRLLLGATRSA